jgi:[acyl-carrier-protein] S-malonyltransferase
MNAALLLPGQGAQHPGMGEEWCQLYPRARETFAQASEQLGFSLEDACWRRGEEVHRTDIAQPGIFVTSVAILSALAGEGLDLRSVPLVAGLSLGEYTALWAAGSLSFADGLGLVRLRGEAMQAASEEIPSSMTSLLGASAEQARALAAIGAREGICSIANWNAPGQIILAGEIRALEAAENAAAEHGVRRTKRLSVAGGFHSECMRPAAKRLEEALSEVPIHPPRCEFVANVTGELEDDPALIRALLAAQVCSPVLWEQSMRTAWARGVESFLEPGPGSVLGGLMRKIEPDARVSSAATPQDWKGANA